MVRQRSEQQFHLPAARCSLANMSDQLQLRLLRTAPFLDFFGNRETVRIRLY
jgi:hypothetical protein